MTAFIEPDWPAPARVVALSTTRIGGVSPPPWHSFNLGQHVGDAPTAVAQNRAVLASLLPVATRIQWLNQVHGTRVIQAVGDGHCPRADASTCARPGVACAVMTADCLPVLFCDRGATVVAAAHAGWRGLCNGVLEATVNAMNSPPGELMAWLGPAIGPAAFEVGPEVRDAFTRRAPEAAACFRSSGDREGHFLADLYALARQRLVAAGVGSVYGGGECTATDKERFYSFRRDGQTGRMASLILLT